MTNRFFKILSKWPSSKALILASLSCLVGLVLMAVSIVFPIPIVVVIGMSVAQGAVGVGVLLFLVSVAAEYRRDVGIAPKPEKT